RPREADLPEVGLDRKLHADGVGELGRPYAGGADDDVRRDLAARRPNTANLSVRELDPVDRAPGDHRRAMRARTARVALRHRLRARVAVERAEGRGEDSFEAGERAELRGLVERYEAARHVVLVLQRDARLERLDVFFTVEEEEVADLTEVDLGTRALA